MEELKVIIGENLANLRKEKKLTQAELAEKFNYTDKAVSKWEKGETSPDIETLYALCEFYGVTIDYLTHPGSKQEKEEFVKKDTDLVSKIWQSALAVSIIWMAVTFTFIYLMMFRDFIYWQVFVWAVPVSGLLVVALNKRYFGSRTLYLISWSVVFWGILTGLFCQLIENAPWPLFILGAPTQVTMLLWYTMKKTK